MRPQNASSSARSQLTSAPRSRTATGSPARRSARRPARCGPSPGASRARRSRRARPRAAPRPSRWSTRSTMSIPKPWKLVGPGEGDRQVDVLSRWRGTGVVFFASPHPTSRVASSETTAPNIARFADDRRVRTLERAMTKAASGAMTIERHRPRRACDAGSKVKPDRRELRTRRRTPRPRCARPRQVAGDQQVQREALPAGDTDAERDERRARRPRAGPRPPGRGAASAAGRRRSATTPANATPAPAEHQRDAGQRGGQITPPGRDERADCDERRRRRRGPRRARRSPAALPHAPGAAVAPTSATSTSAPTASVASASCAKRTPADRGAPISPPKYVGVDEIASERRVREHGEEGRGRDRSDLAPATPTGASTTRYRGAADQEPRSPRNRRARRAPAKSADRDA